MFSYFVNISESTFYFISAIVISIIIGYLAGSIPTGYLVGQAHGVDLTKEGSGSTGATNVLRFLGKKAAATVFAIDFFKGVFAPLLAVFLVNLIVNTIDSMHLNIFKSSQDSLNVLSSSSSVSMSVLIDSLDKHSSLTGFLLVIACLSSLIGHSKSIWIGWKGGKAAATGLGTLYALDWRVGLGVTIIWLSTLYIGKISSLASLIATSCSPILMYFVKVQFLKQLFSSAWIYIAYCLVATIYILIRHKANIERLLNGTEPKIGQAKDKDANLDKTSAETSSLINFEDLHSTMNSIKN
jgi:glycerol-3-phosphate acyltransferase PlsY